MQAVNITLRRRRIDILFGLVWRDPAGLAGSWLVTGPARWQAEGEPLGPQTVRQEEGYIGIDERALRLGAVVHCLNTLVMGRSLSVLGSV